MRTLSVRISGLALVCALLIAGCGPSTTGVGTPALPNNSAVTSASPAFYPTPSVRPQPAPTPRPVGPPTPATCDDPAAQPRTLSLTPGPFHSLAFGNNLQFKAIGDGVNDLTGEVVWQSSNPAVATVDQQGGLAFGMGPGQATITAFWPGTSMSASSVLTVTSGAPTSAVDVEIVNDTDAEDSQVTFNNKTLTATNYSDVGTWVSPYTGITRQIWRTTVSGSGRLPVTMPTNRTAFVEYGVSGDWDLTLINTYSIPMKMEVYNGADGSVPVRTVYASTGTILDRINALSAGMGAAIINSNGNPNYSWTNDLTFASFGHVNGPENILSGTNNNPSPWPTFTKYLDAIVALPTGPDDAQFHIGYDQYGGYSFKGVCTKTGTAPNVNYTVALTPITAGLLPMTVTLSADLLNFLIYTAPCLDGAFTVNGDPASGYCNTTYESAYDSFVSSLNFGYLAGRYPDTVVTAPNNQPINAWYAHPPAAIPGAGARVTNDGFYNPWAALWYNMSDNYGYVYGDRQGRLNPQIWVNGGTDAHAPTRKVRITLLNDLRLDMPEVTVRQSTSSTITLGWSAVPGACSYTVNWSPPFRSPGVAVVSGTSCQLTGLAPDTGYTVSVQANGPSLYSTGSTIVHSHALPLHIATTGTASASLPTFPQTPPASSKSVSFNLQMVWATQWVPLPSNVAINGTASSVNGVVAVTGVAGPAGSPVQNDYRFSFTDYQGNHQTEVVSLLLEQAGTGFTITGVGSSYSPGISVPSSSFMANSERSSNADSSLTLGGTNSWPFSSTLVVTIQYDPIPDKQFFPVLFPSN